jgi:hypothetical protein
LLRIGGSQRQHQGYPKNGWLESLHDGTQPSRPAAERKIIYTAGNFPHGGFLQIHKPLVDNVLYDFQKVRWAPENGDKINR